MGQFFNDFVFTGYSGYFEDEYKCVFIFLDFLNYSNFVLNIQDLLKRVVDIIKQVYFMDFKDDLKLSI